MGSEKSRMLILPSTNEKIEKFINYIMKNWKKILARRIFDKTMEEIKKNWHPNPNLVWEQALENAAPQLMIKSKRLGWAVYHVPIEVQPNKKMFYSSKWILDSARSKKWKSFYLQLSDELLAAYSNQWNAVKKKEDTHKMAKANKAFAYLAKYVK